MTLDPAKNHFDGPIGIPVLSEPDAEGFRTLLSYRPGYHVNATELGMAVADFTAYQIEPETPNQVYGGTTYFLKFADEDEARKMIPAEFWIDDPALPDDMEADPPLKGK